MQICSRCYAQSPDAALQCVNCQAELKEYSTAAVALKRLQQNPRVKAVRISVGGDACPSCQRMQGVYPKEETPALPISGCSHENGCRCFFEPILDEIYP